MRDVEMDLRVRLPIRLLAVARSSAVHAVLRVDWVFDATALTLDGQLATGHRNEKTIRFFNDANVVDDELVVNHDRTVSAEPVLATFA